MVKAGNSRVIATLTPISQAHLAYIKQETGLKDTGAIVMALKTYAELLKRSKV